MIRALIAIVIAGMMNSITIAHSETQHTGEVQARIDAISKTLRCVVCQNQSIYESNSPLAADMRRAVEERVLAGDTDDEVREYLREPYGDFILMRPPFQANTLILWLGPFILMSFFLYWYFRTKGKEPAAVTANKISIEDRAKLDEALWNDVDETGL